MPEDSQPSNRSEEQADDSYDGDHDGGWTTSRRRVLGAAAATGIGAGIASAADVAPFGGARASMQQGAGFFAEGTEVGYETVAEGMTAPTDFAVADEDEERYFVADQTGELWVVTPDEGRQEEPFIDVSDLMVELGTFYGQYASQNQDYDERGLLGVEFHPDFQENGRFYLHYSAPPSEQLEEMQWDHIEVVSEFQADDDLGSGDPESETQIITFPSPQYNHDAGPIAFGPDGYLYIPMGDGGGANDNMYGHVEDWYDENEGGNGQDVESNLLGDVVRIDVDGGDDDGPQNYGIPEDNPFAGEDNPGLDEIYAYGFRNPFGISFDSEGNLFVADAGQNLWEEANVVEAGGNYGWNVKEGTHCFSTENPSEVDESAECPDTAPDEAPYDGAELRDPIVEYPHVYEGEYVGIVIIGGHRYEASTIPDLEGKYVFGEWTRDPQRGEPLGRVLAATPPEDFGDGTDTAAGEDDGTANDTATGTETETETGLGNETDDGTGNETDGGMGAGDETGTDTMGEGTDTPEDGLGNETDDDTGNETDDGMGTGTATGNETEAGTPGGGTEGDVPRDQLWEMEELVFPEEFPYFVRMFGRDNDGELYVLVNQEGTPTGDTGRVVRLVPPEESETPEDAGAETNETTGNETDGETGDEADDEEGTSTFVDENESAGTDTPEANETATPDE